MRCPKCSFISFDDLAVCAKCAGDLSLLSRELNGTCIEARPEFFLGTAIQTPLDGDSFSDSQALPPIDHGGINFDDTSTGGFSPLSSSSVASSSSGFDDSIGLPNEDDVAIELGDIMPIDLDQLDDTSVFSGGSLVETDSFDSSNFALDLDKTETMGVAGINNVDLDLTGKFASTNLELDDDFSDIDIGEADFDFAGDGLLSSTVTPPEGLSLEPGAGGEVSSYDNSVGLDLDDELIAQLSSFTDDLDSSAGVVHGLASDSSVVSDVSGGAADSLELDDSLVAELTGSFSVDDSSGEDSLDYSADHSGSGEFELDAALVAELANDATDDEIFLDVDLDDRGEVSDVVPVVGDFAEDASEAPIEDLTGEFPLVSFSEEEPDLGDLNLSDIDVTDLIEPSADEGLLLDGDSSSVVDALADSEQLKVAVGGSAVEVQSGVDGVDTLGALALTEIDATDLLESSDEDSVWGSGDDSPVPHDLSSGGEPAIVDIDVSGLELPEEISSSSLVQDATPVDDDLFDEIDISELEAELSGSSSVSAKIDEGLPEIELIPDEDDNDQGPPDLPL